MHSYAELAVTTNFSFLRGASHPKEVVAQAAFYNYAAIGIADRNTLAGVVRMHSACKEAGLKPLIGTEFFPASDESQFRVNLKAPVGTRVEETERIVRSMEAIIRANVRPEELKTLVSNVGIPQGRSAVFTTNTGPHSGTIQVYGDEPSPGATDRPAR